MSKIYVLSLDFDGCIFIGYQDSEAFVAANQPFIKTIIARVKQENFSKLILMIGSNRQSLETDIFGCCLLKTPSCFFVYQQLAAEFNKHIPCELDPYLLADSYGNQPAGENFNNALLCYQQAGLGSQAIQADVVNTNTLMNEISKKQGTIFSSFAFDERKLNCIYAQTHRSSSQYPNDEISFTFCDDRTDLLVALHNFFSENSDLLPKLRLHFYHQASTGISLQSLQSDIYGNGPTDYNIAANLRKMTAGLEYELTPFSEKDIMSYLNENNNEGLIKFKQSRDTTKPNESSNNNFPKLSYFFQQRLDENSLQQLLQKQAPHLPYSH